MHLVLKLRDWGAQKLGMIVQSQIVIKYWLAYVGAYQAGIHSKI